MESRPVTPLLDRVQTPADLETLSDRALRQLADELRAGMDAAQIEAKVLAMGWVWRGCGRRQ